MKNMRTDKVYCFKRKFEQKEEQANPNNLYLQFYFQKQQKTGLNLLLPASPLTT